MDRFKRVSKEALALHRAVMSVKAMAAYYGVGVGTVYTRLAMFRIQGAAGKAAKLNPNQVRSIRADPRCYQDIANDYGVHKLTISDIKRGLSWKWLK